jgi:iron complex transport system substrate-binding protein
MRALLFAVLLLAPLTRAGADPVAAAPVSATDFRGKQITLPGPAQRIVCLIESALSGLYMLGAEKQVIGISTNVYQESVFPFYAAMDERIRSHSLPTPGNWDFLNLESLVSLQPDLVIIWSDQKESIQALEEKGIPVFGVFISQFADIHREIAALGELTGTGQRAEELLSYSRQALAELQQKTAGLAAGQRARVYYMWAQGELETSGKESTVDELIGLAGAVNAAGSVSQEHFIANIENVLMWDPEVVVMWYNTKRDAADVLALSRWQSVSAVRQQRVHEFPGVFSCDLWTLKYLFAAQLVAKWCYPAQFAEVDLDSAKTTVFRSLYKGRLPAATVAP